MFCRNCGKEVNDNAVICIHCGSSIKNVATEDADEPKTGMGVLMGLLLGLIGLVVGLCLYKEGTIARKTFIKSWGITFAICAVLSLIFWAIYGAAIFAILGEYGYYTYSLII